MSGPWKWVTVEGRRTNRWPGHILLLLGVRDLTLRSWALGID